MCLLFIYTLGLHSQNKNTNRGMTCENPKLGRERPPISYWSTCVQWSLFNELGLRLWHYHHFQ